jgi:hypothetical protein
MKLLYNPHTLSFSFEVPEMKATSGIQKILGMAIGLKHHRVDYFPYWHRSNSILLGASAAKDNGIVKLWNYSYVDGKHVQNEMGVYEPKTELNCEIIWDAEFCGVGIYEGLGLVGVSSFDIKNKPSKIGYLLYPYFETDAPENKVMPFKVNISDVRVNGKFIKCKFNK